MSGQRPSSGDGSSDEMVLIVMGLALVGSAGAIATALWISAKEWMLDAGVLVSGNDVVLSIPGSNGVGLDAGRIVIGLAIVVGLLALSLTGISHLRQRGEAGLR